MKVIVTVLCLALLPFALAQSTAAGSAEAAEDLIMEENHMERGQDLISGLVDRIVSLGLQAFFYINNLCYRLTGGRFGAEAYCF
ncbi:MAG: hypothetical protein SVE93_03850 [Candidatus Thermoplasmatota archaeon]|nr:hypothetical protein [Candidatus Thermoplasmatota archaeon]